MNTLLWYSKLNFNDNSYHVACISLKDNVFNKNMREIVREWLEFAKSVEKLWKKWWVKPKFLNMKADNRCMKVP